MPNIAPANALLVELAKVLKWELHGEETPPKDLAELKAFISTTFMKHTAMDVLQLLAECEDYVVNDLERASVHALGPDYPLLASEFLHTFIKEFCT